MNRDNLKIADKRSARRSQGEYAQTAKVTSTGFQSSTRAYLSRKKKFAKLARIRRKFGDTFSAASDAELIAQAVAEGRVTKCPPRTYARPELA